MDKTENNKKMLIDEFCKLSQQTEKDYLIGGFMDFEIEPINKPYIFIRNNNKSVMHFKTDWSDLMSVIEKIESLGYWTELWSGSQSRFRIGRINSQKAILEFSCPTKIETVYNAVIEFIKRYNEEKL